MSGFTQLNGAWTSYTPALTSLTGTITSTSSPVGAYQQNGKTVRFRASVTISNNGTGASANLMSLPVTPKSSVIQVLSGVETGVGGLICRAYADGTANVTVTTTAAGYPGATGATIHVSGEYEAE